MYNSTIWEHFRHPRNRKELDNPDAVGSSRYPRCGDKMQLFFRLEDEKITQVTFQAHGCGPTIAAASLGTEMLQGLSVDQARRLSAFTLDDALGGLPVSKRHALLMFIECLHQALGPRINER